MSAAQDLWRLSAAALAERVADGVAATDAVESGWSGPAAAWEASVHAVVHSDPVARARGAKAATSGA